MLIAKKRLDTRGPHISGCKSHPTIAPAGMIIRIGSTGSRLDPISARSVLGSIGRSDSDLHYSDAHGRSANPSNSDSAARTPTVKHKLWTRAYSDWTRTGRTWPSDSADRPTICIRIRIPRVACEIRAGACWPMGLSSSGPLPLLRGAGWPGHPASRESFPVPENYPTRQNPSTRIDCKSKL